MIPVIFCGADYRDWPRWMFWKVGHREHVYRYTLSYPNEPVFDAHCPGFELVGGGEPDV